MKTLFETKPVGTVHVVLTVTHEGKTFTFKRVMDDNEFAAIITPRREVSYAGEIVSTAEFRVSPLLRPFVRWFNARRLRALTAACYDQAHASVAFVA